MTTIECYEWSCLHLFTTPNYLWPDWSLTHVCEVSGPHFLLMEEGIIVKILFC